MTISGEKVICDMCGKTYKFFIWAFGSDKHLCRKCVTKRPSAYLDNIDAIDIDKEHDVIYDEIEEQNQRDFPRDTQKRSPKKQTHISRSDYRKHERRMDKQTIRKFRRMGRSAAIDVTGLG